MKFRVESVPRLFSEGIVDDGGRGSRREEVSGRKASPAGTAREGYGVTRLLQALPLLVRAMRESGYARTLPDPGAAPPRADGFCGLSRVGSGAQVAKGYRRGMMPLSVIGVTGWWMPPQRWTLDPAGAKARHAEDERFVSGDMAFAIDERFEAVLQRCAEATMVLSGPLMTAFRQLFELGVAHSFEVSDRRGDLAGGGFGVRLGGVFLVHSSFGGTSGAERAGFFGLHRHLAAWGFALCEARDGERLRSLGYRPVPRAAFEADVARHVDGGRAGAWVARPSVLIGGTTRHGVRAAR